MNGGVVDGSDGWDACGSRSVGKHARSTVVAQQQQQQAQNDSSEHKGSNTESGRGGPAPATGVPLAEHWPLPLSCRTQGTLPDSTFHPCLAMLG